MKIILSPAKKMNEDTDTFDVRSLPVYIRKTEKILDTLKSKSNSELQQIWKCNDKIAAVNIDRLEYIDIYNKLTPAIIAYEGIAYQYMAPSVLEDEKLEYLHNNLYILSAFYGPLRAFDGVRAYRLEMQAELSVEASKDLYDFWKDDLYNTVNDDSHIIINLASKEYSRCIEKYLTDKDRYITINFVEEYKGKLVTKATHAKMARGEMVRYMAENNIEDIEKLKNFDRLNYRYCEDLSDEKQLTFIRTV